MNLERTGNGPGGVLELVMRCLAALKTVEAELAALCLTSGLTSLGGAVREMGNGKCEAIKRLTC